MEVDDKVSRICRVYITLCPLTNHKSGFDIVRGGQAIESGLWSEGQDRVHVVLHDPDSPTPSL